eukprot:gene340-973_t
MSSLRNAQKGRQRQYKERGQLSNRKHLGLLEKHKDYVARARDYHKKEKQLRILRRKASERNPDEFYFKMVNQKTKEGVHTISKNKNYTADQLKLMKTQDLNYVNMKRNVERKKIEKLQGELHFLDNADNAGRQHVFFVDSAKEVQNFDPAKKLRTLPEFLERAHNRPTSEMMEKSLNIADDHAELAEKKKGQSYKELEQRLKREKLLDETRMEMELQKKLMGKGRRRKIEDGDKGVYKWKRQRKR